MLGRVKLRVGSRYGIGISLFAGAGLAISVLCDPAPVLLGFRNTCKMLGVSVVKHFQATNFNPPKRAVIVSRPPYSVIKYP